MPSFVFKRQSSEIKCHIRLSYKQSNSVQAPITGPPWCKETFEMWTYKVPHRCISGPASPAAATLGMPGLSSEQTVIGIVLVCARPHHHPRICRRSFGTLAQPRPPPPHTDENDGDDAEDNDAILRRAPQMLVFRVSLSVTPLLSCCSAPKDRMFLAFICFKNAFGWRSICKLSQFVSMAALHQI